MLDTHARRYVQPAFDAGAALAERAGITPVQLTVIAFAIGLAGGVSVALDQAPAAIALLWLSGYLDAVDGTLARRAGRTSAWGTVLDITCDRIVEFAVLAGLALRFPESRMAIIGLLGAIIFSNVVFLLVGALSRETWGEGVLLPGRLVGEDGGFHSPELDDRVDDRPFAADIRVHSLGDVYRITAVARGPWFF